MARNMLVAYFSCTGTTARAAQTLAKATGAELFEIKPAVPYTSADLDWNDARSRSSVEMKDPSSRPEIATTVEDMDAYDIVFVGFPVWWYTAPTIINTFLESYDFSGKTVVPFGTSGGTPASSGEKSMRASCSGDVIWKPAKTLNGRPSADALRNWVADLGL